MESSRTDFEVLGLGLEASSPRKMACPRLEDSTIFWIVKILWSAWKIFWKTFFCGDRWKNFCKDLFFFLESTCTCVLGPRPWPRAFVSLASRVSVLGKAVLGLGFFLCPWPRALCPRLRLCYLHKRWERGMYSFLTLPNSMSTKRKRLSQKADLVFMSAWTRITWYFCRTWTRRN